MYSPELNKNMTQRTWDMRERENLTAPPRQVNDTYNRVTGHHRPQEHVNTVLEHVIIPITKWNCNIYVVGITDGAERFMEYMDATVPDPNFKIFPGRNVKGIAFIESSHNQEKVSKHPHNLPMVAFFSLTSSSNTPA